MITRRKLLRATALAAPAIIAGGWFPHGSLPTSSGLTVNLTFDASWDIAANLGAGLPYSGGTLNYPEIGFADAPQMALARAILDTFISTLKTLTTSTGTINLVIGCGRYYAGGFYTPNGEAANHYEVPFARSWAQVQSLISSLPTAQKNLWTVPGSDPAFSPGHWNVSTSHYAILNNSTDTGATYVSFAAPGSHEMTVTYSPGWDYAGGSYSFQQSCWHEITQALGREWVTGSSQWIASLLAYMSAGNLAVSVTNWTGAYFSVDGGTTHLSPLQLRVGSGDLLDWTAATGGPFCYGWGGSHSPSSTDDYKMLAALYPPSAACLTAAGL